MKYFLYQSRKSRVLLVEHTRKGWDYLIDEMEGDNRMSLHEAQEEGFDVDGSFDEGRIYMDDGGEIYTIEVTEPR